MEKSIISVKKLGKRYLLGLGGGERYRALRDVMANSVKSLFKRSNKNKNSQEFWALKDVTFDIRPGEKVGIIGRNGAGKSTLLKILSEITEPTEGEVHIHGRVASLLEVGTGFHPELTGKENIFMNGAILGMRRAEIKKKFDEIVAFAEIEKFLDTPVKRYSSGMYVRLAFSVAAHLEPDILLVDEVLAVGDIKFQKKCLGKMEDISSKEGRTILFVSHNLASVKRLCTKAILLTLGRISKEGDVDVVTDKYINESLQNTEMQLLNDRKDRQGSAVIKFTSVVMRDENDKIVSHFKSGQNIKFSIYFMNNTGEELRNLFIALGIDDISGNRLTNIHNELTGEYFEVVEPDINCVDIEIKKLSLMPGRYWVALSGALSGEMADWVRQAFYFDVEEGDFYNTGKVIPAGAGIFLTDFNYKLKHE